MICFFVHRPTENLLQSCFVISVENVIVQSEIKTSGVVSSVLFFSSGVP
jgi:hypothetical protein